MAHETNRNSNTSNAIRNKSATTATASTMNTGLKNLMTSILHISPSLIWLVVFLPALLYFLVTRLPSALSNRIFYGMEYGIPITTHIRVFHNTTTSSSHHQQFVKLFPFVKYPTSSIPKQQQQQQQQLPPHNDTFELRYPLQLIYEIPIVKYISTTSTTTKIPTAVVDIIYRYDSILGRGYVLYTTNNTNRIYRYEIGNGLFPIGNTLFMDRACHRSNISHRYTKHEVDDDDDEGVFGCGPLALEYDVDTTSTTTTTSTANIDGKLIIAEYGEHRIVRLEEEFGARTPLMMHMPRPQSISSPKQPQQQQQRLSNPYRMLYTSYGNLLLVVNTPLEVNNDNNNDSDCMLHNETNHPQCRLTNNTSNATVAMIIVVPNTLHTPPLINLQQSREAHYWDTIQQHPQQRQQLIKQQNEEPYIYYSNPSQVLWIGGIAISSDGRTLYGIAEIIPSTTATAESTSTSMVLFQLSLNEGNDDDDDDNEEEDSKEQPKHQQQPELKILMDLSKYFYYDTDPYRDDAIQHPSPLVRSAAMVLGQRSGILYITIPEGMLFVDPVTNHVIGQLPIPPSSSKTQDIHNSDTHLMSSITKKTLSNPTALTLSGDGYLYIAANHNRLYRIRTNDIPVVFRPKKTKSGTATKHR